MYKGLIFVCLVAATAACGTKDETNNGNNGFNNGITNNNGTTGSNNGATNNGVTANNGTTAGNNGSTGGTNGTTGGTTGGGGLTWTAVNGPCPGSRTASVLFLDADEGLLGCGENADGEGLFHTTDGGTTWAPIRSWADLRVFDIRFLNGAVYVAGGDNLGGTRESVWRLDAAFKGTAIYTASNQVGNVQQAENIAIGTDGRAVIDSLTGSGIAVRGPAEDMFTEVGTISEDVIANPNTPGFQVRRIDFFEDEIYATGSLINNPPRVYLASKDPAATYHVTKVELDNADAEMLDLHVYSKTSMVIAGFSQSGTVANRSPLIFVGDGDLYDAANWSEIDVFAQGIEFAGGVRAISVAGQDILAVGEKFPTSKGGFALFSADGGKTWKDVSPVDKISALSEAFLWADGTAFIGGGGGNAFTVSGLK